MLARIPEPELMDSPDQARAYAEADFSESNQRFADHLVQHYSARPQHGLLCDLGCGPADLVVRLARALPHWRFLAVDGGPNMLASGRRACAAAGLSERVELRLAYLPDPQLPAAVADAVVSNSVLHHLNDPLTLWHSIRQVAKPGAYFQVMDLARPDNREAARHIVNTYAGDAHPVLQEDFYNSLLAAYTAAEVRAQLSACGFNDYTLLPITDRHWLVYGSVPAGQP